MKKKTKKQVDKDTLAEITKEMARPRVAMSAREPSPMFRSEPIVRNT
jgi:hypothetical protein